jgi:predicted nuclease with TOPRIM domain
MVKYLLPVSFILIFSLTFLNAAVEKHHHICYKGTTDGFLDGAELEIKGSTVYITQQDEDKITVKITRSGDLYLDKKKIDTNRRGRELLKQFNHDIRELLDSAEKLGYEAGKIGVEGAHIASSAVSGLLDAFFTEATLEDLDKELEKKAEKIEEKAKKLEKKAEKIEQQAEELEELQAELKAQIEELEELEWF